MFQLQTATATIDFETYAEAREAQRIHPERLGSVIAESVAPWNGKRAEPEITGKSLELFLAYAWDAANWSGTPPVGHNVGGSKADRGNLTQLKKVGLITTELSDGDTWIHFTEKGHQLANSYGIEI